VEEAIKSEEICSLETDLPGFNPIIVEEAIKSKVYLTGGTKVSVVSILSLWKRPLKVNY